MVAIAYLPTSAQPPAANDVDAAIAGVQAAIDRLESAMHVADTHDVPHAISAIRAVDRVAGLIDARRHRQVVQAAGAEPVALSNRAAGSRDSRVGDIHAVAMGAMLGCSADRARTMAHQSRVLCLELPQVLEALDRGAVTGYQSALAVDGWIELNHRWAAASSDAPPSLAADFQERVLARVGTTTMAEYRRRIRLAVALLAPTEASAAHAAEHDERCVTLSPAGNGMAWLRAYLDASKAASVMQVLENAARCDATLTGNQSQRVADALVGIVTGQSDLSPASRSAAAEVQLLVSADSLASGALSAQIAGTELLVEGHALRELMADARFRRLLVDNEGRLLDFGRTTYRPPVALADHVVARDRTCRAPGCGRPARYTDLDHVVPWNDGGETTDTNLAALCRTHHVLKTHGGWDYRRAADGSTLWRLPNGAGVTRPPGDYADHNPGRVPDSSAGSRPPGDRDDPDDDPPPF